jgi:hypothetical protein
MATLFEFSMPALERFFRRVPQLTNGRASAFAEFDIEPGGSNAVFVRTHELPFSSPRIPSHLSPLTAPVKLLMGPLVATFPAPDFSKVTFLVIGRNG